MSTELVIVALFVYCVGAMAILAFASYTVLCFAVEIGQQVNKLWSNFLHFHQFKRFYAVIIRMRREISELTEEEAEEFERYLRDLFSRRPHA